MKIRRGLRRARHAHSLDGELRPALERAFAQGGVERITVPVDHSENQRVLVDELKVHA